MSKQFNDPESVQEANEMEADDLSTIERCLTFESAGLILYISTSNVIEIINNHTITTLPLMPSYIKGIINLRGQILPVMDIQQRMGKGPTQFTGSACIIVLDIDSVSLGIIVDSVRQVMDIDLRDVRPIPLKNRQKLLNGMVNMEDGTVFMSIDCQALTVPE